ncbi:MAG: glutathione peroxidase [Planctomycetales bacterium]|nr:glutathione peroxidase [Planctomycetales bacterium]
MKSRVFAICMSILLISANANGDEPVKGEKKTNHPIYSQKMKSLTGEEVDLSKYRGKTLLIVNTASRCGATPQYEPLQALHEKYGEKGLAVLGFPCNQFGSQEPGSAKQIAEFCERNYGVKFDMFSKVDVNGDDAAPIYKYLTSKQAGIDDTGAIKWNFEKFLVSKDGNVLARFRTGTSPDSPEVIELIEKALR